MKRCLDELLTARLVRLGIATTSLVLAIQVAAGWRRINGDGVSYLQVGQAILDNHFRAGYAGYWAPLYGIVGALSASAAEMAGFDRLVGVQCFNLLLALGNVIASVCFVRQLLHYLQIPKESLKGIGLQLYGLGLLTLLLTRYGGVTLLTPDLAVSALVLMAGTETLKVQREEFDWSGAVRIGAIFGIGYWFKSTFFPLWFVWLAIAVGTLWRRRAEWSRLGLAFGVWLSLAAPLVAMTSEAAGRLSFGENGRLNFLWYVNGIPNRYWQGQPPEYGTPVHQMVRLVETPRVYAFGDVFPNAAYAPWYDPAYWYAGARTRWSSVRLLHAIKANLASMRRLWLSRFLLPYTLLMASGFVFALWRIEYRGFAWLAIFALAPFSLILIHTEPRFFYAQTFMLLAVGAFMVSVRSVGSKQARALVVLHSILALWGWGIGLGTATHSGQQVELRSIKVALEEEGIRPREKICSIGDTAGTGSWAWYSRVRVVAEMPLAEYRRVVRERGAVPVEVEEAFRSAGCVAAVASLAPGDPAPKGWSRVAVADGYYLKVLR